ncbi:MAG: GntR family transcriptional regulator [Nocardioides sp.]
MWASSARNSSDVGAVGPGLNLSELALAQEFGVSRTPVREALKQLQSEGLVEIRPRVGTFVTAPSPREISELFEVKELLEGAAARLLAQRGRVRELDELEETVRLADVAVARNQQERYAGLVTQFHDLIIRGADNAKLAAHYRMLMNQLAYPRLVTTSLRQPGRPLESDREHHLVLELIVAKDGDSAERVIRDHVRAARRAPSVRLNPCPERPHHAQRSRPFHRRRVDPRRDHLRRRRPGHWLSHRFRE